MKNVMVQQCPISQIQTEKREKKRVGNGKKGREKRERDREYVKYRNMNLIID